MSESANFDLESLGLEIAREIAGSDAVERVAVVRGIDPEDRPAYYFSFVIDQGRARQGIGLITARLLQRLGGELTARHDPHALVVRMVGPDDEQSRINA